MSYRFKRDEPVVEGLRRAAREQIDRAIEALEDDEVDTRETIHEVRKRCKKIRGLIRVCRPAFEKTYSRENERYRDAARTFSDLRDATSMIECVRGLGARYGEAAEEELAPIREALQERREETEATLDVRGRLEAFGDELEKGRKAAGSWQLDREGFDAIGPGVERTYGRARRAMRRTATDDRAETWHEWRKRVKYHRYHCRLLRDLWSPIMSARRDEARRLSDLLGDAHDLDVLRETLASEPERFGGERVIRGAVSLCEARRAELRAWAGPAGARLEAMDRAWRFEGALGATLPEGSSAPLR